eukprot:2079396-Amphidinium_carterae.3
MLGERLGVVQGRVVVELAPSLRWRLVHCSPHRTRPVANAPLAYWPIVFALVVLFTSDLCEVLVDDCLADDRFLR